MQFGEPNDISMPEEQNIQQEESEEDKEKFPEAGIQPGMPEPSITGQPLTENMEVHHHPDLHHKKKHFKEYFLEFLMIFLAVTMGFIAENIREHLSDNEKENYYISSLVKNLKDDTTMLRYVITANTDQMKGFDSIRNVSKDKLADVKVQDSLFYYTMKYLFNSVYFKSNDITMVQLRNAGGYRLIKNNSVLDSIAVYEANLNYIQDQYKFVEDGLVKTQDNVLQIFDMAYTKKLRTFPTSVYVMVTADKDKINRYYNYCWVTEIAINGYTQMLEGHRKYLTSLILFLQKEYD